MKESIIMATVKGRHEMPVDKYIFEGEIENPSDHAAIYGHVENVLKEEMEKAENKYFTVYVTGLTTVTVAVVKFCALYGVGLVLMHYDRDLDGYLSDEVFK